MISFDHTILRCPLTHESLRILYGDEAGFLIHKYDPEFQKNNPITTGFINSSETYFYPVVEDIILLLPVYALFIGHEDGDNRNEMLFDKERVFKYYNQISYNTRNGLKIYGDSEKWVDFRGITSNYIQHSFSRAKKYLSQKGRYLLDIASGPIGLKEYMELSDNFEVRICMDISFNALIQAKQNYSDRPGIFICADITNIPLQDNMGDSLLCQHTLYHIPKNEQETAVNEMYRVIKPGGSVVIVYSLFYHSWFMNISLLPVQLYRILRHMAGKVYVRVFSGRPRLYFYPHSLRWFKNTFSFADKMRFYCWRSTNKYFLKFYVHKWFGGKKLLSYLQKSEDRYPEFWGKLGEYPVIVIRK